MDNSECVCVVFLSTAWRVVHGLAPVVVREAGSDREPMRGSAERCLCHLTKRPLKQIWEQIWAFEL